jgi:hypothetical protein
VSKRGDRPGRGRQLCGPSRDLPAQLCCKNLDAGARAQSRREHVAVSHRSPIEARARSDIKIVRPSAFAVLRLMASSTLVDCCTGKSAGFSPLKMRFVWSAARQPIGQLAKMPGCSLERLLGRAAGEKLTALAWNRDPREIRTHQSTIGRSPVSARPRGLLKSARICVIEAGPLPARLNLITLSVAYLDTRSDPNSSIAVPNRPTASPVAVWNVYGYRFSVVHRRRTSRRYPKKCAQRQSTKQGRYKIVPRCRLLRRDASKRHGNRTARNRNPLHVPPPSHPVTFL